MSAFGQLVTFTATVAPQYTGLPTGTVTFSVDSVAITPDVALDGTGSASYATSDLNVVDSPHSVDAHYNGDDNFADSDAVTLSYVVVQATTTTTITPDIASG